MNLRRMMATAIWGGVLSLSLVSVFVAGDECAKDHDVDLTSCTSEDKCWKDFISKNLKPYKFKAVKKGDAEGKFVADPTNVKFEPKDAKAKDADGKACGADKYTTEGKLTTDDLKVGDVTCAADKVVTVNLTPTAYGTAIPLKCTAKGSGGGIPCWVWIVIIAVVLIGGGVAAFFLLGGGGGAAAEDADDDEEEDDENV